MSEIVIEDNYYKLYGRRCSNCLAYMAPHTMEPQDWGWQHQVGMCIDLHQWQYWNTYIPSCIEWEAIANPIV